MPQVSEQAINNTLARELMGWRERWSIDDDNRDRWVDASTMPNKVKYLQTDWNPCRNREQLAECEAKIEEKGLASKYVQRLAAAVMEPEPPPGMALLAIRTAPPDLAARALYQVVKENCNAVEAD